MIIDSVGDFQQLDSMIQGLDLAEKTMSFAGPSQWLGILLTIILFGTFIYYIIEVVRKRTPIYTPFMYLVLIALWWSLAFHPSVSVTMGNAYASPNLTTRQAQLRDQVNSLQAKVGAMKKQPFVSDPRPTKELAKAKQKLSFIDQMVAAQTAPVTKTSPLIAITYTFARALYLGAEAIVEAVAPRNMSERFYQAQIVRTMGDEPFLSPNEQQMAHQLSNCLLAKQMYLSHAAKTAKRVMRLDALRKDPAKNKAEIQVAADRIRFEQKQVADQCSQMSARLMKSVDDAITPEEISQYETAYIVPFWNPFTDRTGGVGARKKTNKEKRAFLLAQAGLPLAQIKGMSTRQLAKVFIRYKHIKAMSDMWMNGDLNDQVQTNNKVNQNDGYKTLIGGGLMDWMAGFLLSVKPIIHLVMNFAWMAVFFSGAVAGVLSLLPGWHFKSVIYLFLAFLFLGLWGVTNNMTAAWSAHLANGYVGAQKAPEGARNSFVRLVSGTYDNLVGGFETDALVATGAGARPAMASRNIIISALQKMPKWAKVGGPVGLGVSAIAAVGQSGYAANSQINKEGTAFEKLIAKEAGGLNPALDYALSGMLQAQQKSLRSAAAHADVIEGLLLLAGPILVGIIFFGGAHRLMGSLNSASAGQAAGAAGNTIAGAGFGRFFGGGGRISPPK